MNKLKKSLNKVLFNRIYDLAPESDKIEYDGVKVVFVNMDKFGKEGEVVEKNGEVCYIQRTGKDSKQFGYIATLSEKENGITSGTEVQTYVNRAGEKFNISSRDVNSNEFRTRIRLAAKNATAIIKKENELARQEQQHLVDDFEKGEENMNEDDVKNVNTDELVDDAQKHASQSVVAVATKIKEDLENVTTSDDLKEDVEEEVQSVVENADLEEVGASENDDDIINEVVEQRAEEEQTEEKQEEVVLPVEETTAEADETIENAKETAKSGIEYYSPIFKEDNTSLKRTVGEKEFQIFAGMDADGFTGKFYDYVKKDNKFVEISDEEISKDDLKEYFMLTREVSESGEYKYDLKSFNEEAAPIVEKDAEIEPAVEDVEVEEPRETEVDFVSNKEPVFYNGKIRVVKDYYRDRKDPSKIEFRKTVAGADSGRGMIFLAADSNLDDFDENGQSMYFLNLDNVNKKLGLKNDEEIKEYIKNHNNVKELADLGAVVVDGRPENKGRVGNLQVAKTFTFKTYDAKGNKQDKVVEIQSPRKLVWRNLLKFTHNNYDKNEANGRSAKGAGKIIQGIIAPVVCAAISAVTALGVCSFFGTGFAPNDLSEQARMNAENQTKILVENSLKSNETNAVPAAFSFVAGNENEVSTLLRYAVNPTSGKMEVVGTGLLYGIINEDVETLKHSGVGYLKGYDYTQSALEGNAAVIGREVTLERNAAQTSLTDENGNFVHVYPCGASVTTDVVEAIEWRMNNKGESEENAAAWVASYEVAEEKTFEEITASGNLNKDDDVVTGANGEMTDAERLAYQNAIKTSGTIEISSRYTINNIRYVEYTETKDGVKTEKCCAYDINGQDLSTIDKLETFLKSAESEIYSKLSVEKDGFYTQAQYENYCSRNKMDVDGVLWYKSEGAGQQTSGKVTKDVLEVSVVAINAAHTEAKEKDYQVKSDKAVNPSINSSLALACVINVNGDMPNGYEIVDVTSSQTERSL